MISKYIALYKIAQGSRCAVTILLVFDEGWKLYCCWKVLSWINVWDTTLRTAISGDGLTIVRFYRMKREPMMETGVLERVGDWRFNPLDDVRWLFEVGRRVNASTYVSSSTLMRGHDGWCLAVRSIERSTCDYVDALLTRYWCTNGGTLRTVDRGCTVYTPAGYRVTFSINEVNPQRLVFDESW